MSYLWDLNPGLHQFEVDCFRHCATRAHRQRSENIAALCPQLRYASLCQYVECCIDMISTLLVRHKTTGMMFNWWLATAEIRKKKLKNKTYKWGLNSCLYSFQLNVLTTVLPELKCLGKENIANLGNQIRGPMQFRGINMAQSKVFKHFRYNV